MDEQTSKHLWFDDHRAASMLLDKPAMGTIRVIGDELDFPRRTVEAHTVAWLDQLLGLIKEGHS
jgi:hypothetical protein